MDYSKWKTIKIDPLKIKLDELNPRVILDDYNQENIREYLIEYFEVLELANGIAENNGIPPTERILCVQENDEIIVVEGNRRVTACQILKKPELLPLDLRQRLSKNSATDNFLEEIEVVVAPNRDVTENYITMRHTGSGTKRWSRLAENRRYIIRHIDKNQSINHISKVLNVTPYQVRRGIQFYFFIEYIRNNLDWSTEEKEILNNPLLETTKIDRFLPFSTKAKEIMTINFDAKHNVIYDIPKENFDKALKIIVKKIFITEEINTRSSLDKVFNEEIISICSAKKEISKPPHTNTKDVEDSYGKNIERNPKKDEETKKTEKPTNQSGQQNNSGSKNQRKKQQSKKKYEETKKPSKRQSHPKERQYPFEGINYSGNIVGISQTLFELHRINIKNFPFSATVLVRTLLECTIQEYVIKKNIDLNIKGKDTIKDKSIAAILSICSNKDNGNFKKLRDGNKVVARIIDESNNLKDADELNLVTHGNYRAPSIDALWDIERRWYAAIEIMIEHISGQEP